MNERGDISPTLQHWLADGPTRMPDECVNVVADRIARHRRRRGLRLPLAATTEGFVGWQLPRDVDCWSSRWSQQP